MKTSIKFKAIGLRGESIKKTIKIECPDFIEKKSVFTQTINEKLYSSDIITSVETQIMEWLDEQDKHGLMNKEDWILISDYEVVKYKIKSKKVKNDKLVVAEPITKKVMVQQTKKEKVIEIISTLITDKDLLIEFAVVYSAMEDSIKSLSIEKQISVVLNAVGVASQAAGVAYKSMSDIISGRSEEKEVDQELTIDGYLSRHGVEDLHRHDVTKVVGDV